ncbi:ATP-grasp domain-containing protein [Candidatus Flexifilum breve]|uniref:ATP-grasp domain-containing protein n=1 Tax=Candidatus Flexifilum breve TaxID=3140694 RepID=UPI0031CCC9B0
MLKPVQGASSFDVFRVESLDALRGRYEAILNQREMQHRDTPFNSGDRDESWLVWQRGLTMVLEEYLDGDEYDIDCLLSDGELVYASVTGEKPQPMMIETGARLPALCPVEHETALIDMAQKTLKVLGYTDGVFHVEAKYTARGPRLIEVNARMGGGPIHLMNRQVWGVDLIEQYLLTSLGLPISPPQARATNLSLIRHSGRTVYGYCHPRRFSRPSEPSS